MRAAQWRRGPAEEDEESAFVSMTDMTVSFLFIVMILLAFFASQFSEQEVVPRTTYDDIVTERDAARADLAQRERELERLRSDLALARETADRLRAEAQRLTLALDQAKAEAVILRVSLEHAEGEVDLLHASLDRTMTELEAARDEAARLGAELAALANRVDLLSRALTRARSDLALSRETEARLRARIGMLETQIAALRLPDPLEAYLAAAGQERRRLLETLRDQLMVEFPGLNVVISAEGDALRFQGEGLFASGSYKLTAERARVVERIAERLDTLLPCYTLGARTRWDATCNPGLAVIEAVQIEGHTDDVGGDLSNLELSALRGSATYGAMTEQVPGLLDHLNMAGQAVLSVAGYGKNRPVTSNDTLEGRAVNRRIDLRFIMFSPGRSEEIEIIRAALAERPLPDAVP